METGSSSEQPARWPAQRETAPADFTTFYRATYRDLLRAAMYSGAQVHEAEEVTDATMEEVLRRWASIDQPRAYAFKALSSNLKKYKGRDQDRIRRRQVERGEVVIGGQDAGLVRWEDVQWITQLLECLPPSQREVVILLVDDMKPGEIAEFLGITPGAARQRLLLARRRLKQILQEQRQAEQRLPRKPGPTKEVTQ